jgi:uncharacterized protein YodC (DUF2158 family)
MGQETFASGDTVKLKSGGPVMTVEKTGISARTKQPAVWCAWFDGQKLARDMFAQGAIEKTKPDTLA